MLERLARFSVRSRRLVIMSWIAFVATALTLGILLAGPSNSSFANPGTESQTAADLLDAAGGGTDMRSAGQLVVAVDPALSDGLENADVRTALDSLLTRIDGIENVEVESLYGPEAWGQISADGTIGYSELDLGSGTDADITARSELVKGLVDGARIPDVHLELSGDIFVALELGGMAEGIGLLLALVILLIAFGSLIAAGLPVVTALAGVGVGVAIVFLLSNIVAVPNFAVSLTAMLGIGVGIDYALLIVTRYRTGLHDGLTVENAVVRAMSTAGRSVLFAGATVAVAISGMLVMGGGMGWAMVIAAGSGVLGVMAAALTLLPALLAVVGTRIEKLHIGRKRRPAKPAASGPAYRWSRFVQRHPWPSAIGATLMLIILALPVFSLRLGFSDPGNRPETDTTRRAYDLLAEGYGDGANGPLILVGTLPNGSASMAVLDGAATSIAEVPGVSSASPAMRVGDGSVAIVRVTPDTGPQAEATYDLVHTLRETVLPQLTAGTGVQVSITGATAAGIDSAETTATRLPWMLLLVLSASFLLLAFAFRSLVVPLKAIVMNLLSMGAAFGVLVAVFQWGWGLDLIGVGRTGPVEAWVPMMLFAIAYGLSMDYEVFLLSRVREEYQRTKDSSKSVADGVAKTATVSTAAAAIMVAVFASFIFFDDRGLKTMGLGLAAAVLVDATIVRMLLVPAVMELLGDRNWYWPKALQRVRTMEGHHMEGNAAEPIIDSHDELVPSISSQLEHSRG